MLPFTLSAAGVYHSVQAQTTTQDFFLLMPFLNRSNRCAKHETAHPKTSLEKLPVRQSVLVRRYIHPWGRMYTPYTWMIFFFGHPQYTLLRGCQPKYIHTQKKKNHIPAHHTYQTGCYAGVFILTRTSPRALIIFWNLSLSESSQVGSLFPFTKIWWPKLNLKVKSTPGTVSYWAYLVTAHV